MVEEAGVDEAAGAGADRFADLAGEAEGCAITDAFEEADGCADGAGLELVGGWAGE
jgi:hypothetical protein